MLWQNETEHDKGVGRLGRSVATFTLSAEKEAFEQKPEAGGGMSHADISGQSVPAGGKSQGKAHRKEIRVHVLRIIRCGSQRTEVRSQRSHVGFGGSLLKMKPLASTLHAVESY